MFPNAKGSELFSVLATIDPASQAVGTVTTGWISAGNHHSLLALVQSGVLGTGATLDAKLQQATDASGTGAKDVTGKAITQIVKATRRWSLASASEMGSPAGGVINCMGM